MKLAAVAPRYGWTDLAHSLVPTGRHFQTPDRMPAADGCDSGTIDTSGADCGGPTAFGVPKLSIVAGLYVSGKTGVGPDAPHTTFPVDIDEVFFCLQGIYPPPGICDATIRSSLQRFLNGRSAYYQDRFFRKIEKRKGFRTPIFNAATNTDPLLPGSENRRMLNRIRDLVPNYPIQVHHGDYQHFVQNKAREWGDVCGADNHVCVAGDYPPGNYDARPTGLQRIGVTSRLNRFVDHYAKPRLNANERRPAFDVSATLQVCPAISPDDPGAPGKMFTAPTFERLTRGFLDLDFDAAQSTSSDAGSNPHAANSDPVANSVNNGGACPVETNGPGPGVALYESGRLAGRKTMIGAPRLTVGFEPAPGASAVELNARIYDVLPGAAP